MSDFFNQGHCCSRSNPVSMRWPTFRDRSNLLITCAWHGVHAQWVEVPKELSKILGYRDSQKREQTSPHPRLPPSAFFGYMGRSRVKIVMTKGQLLWGVARGSRHTTTYIYILIKKIFYRVTFFLFSFFAKFLQGLPAKRYFRLFIWLFFFFFLGTISGSGSLLKDNITYYFKFLKK